MPVTASSFAAADTTNYQELEKFMSVYQQVKEHYVVPVDDHTLIKGAIDGMLPRSTRIPPMPKAPNTTR